MKWTDRIRQIKNKAELEKKKEKKESEVLAVKLLEKIQESREILKDFALASNACVFYNDQRHKEKDPETGRIYYAGGITLRIEKKKKFFGKLLFPLGEKVDPALLKRKSQIARMNFPHPKAIKKKEGYEDAVKFVYADRAKKISLDKFSSHWLKKNLEEAYQYFLSKEKV